MCNAFAGSYLEAASRGASVSPRGLSPSSSRPAKEAHEEATPSDPAELHGYDSEETPPGLVSESDSDDEEDYDEDDTSQKSNCSEDDAPLSEVDVNRINGRDPSNGPAAAEVAAAAPEAAAAARGATQSQPRPSRRYARPPQRFDDESPSKPNPAQGVMN